MEPSVDAVATNRVSWDARVPIHLRSALYRPNLEALRAGGECLDEEVASHLGPVDGLEVLHLQCHIGLDTLSLARRGARVTGVDFSEPAIEAARGLAGEFGIEARFVVSAVADAPVALSGETFDMVFATEGVLCWISDLRQWMAVAAALLRPGGRLFLMDGHPFVDVFDDDADAPHGIAIRKGYFDRGPHRFGPGPTYADDGTGAVTPATVQYTHTLGDVVNAALVAGMQIDALHESPRCGFAKFAGMTTPDQRQFHLAAPLTGTLPFRFTLQAHRPH